MAVLLPWLRRTRAALFGGIRHFRQRRTTITGDNYTLIGLGLAALLVIWLVFSVVKRIFGLLLLAALAVAGFVLWNNPALLGTVLEAGQSLWPAN